MGSGLVANLVGKDRDLLIGEINVLYAKVGALEAENQGHIWRTSVLEKQIGGLIGDLKFEQLKNGELNEKMPAAEKQIDRFSKALDSERKELSEVR